MEDVTNYSCDVLVVGAGGAGLRAAIEAADQKVSVILIGKTLLGKAHTVMAEGGINAALGNVNPEDSWEVHFADTMREGQFLNDWRMVEIMVREAPFIIHELESFGALFDRTPEGKVMQRAFGGHTYKRTCHIGDRTGLEIMQVLMAEVRKRQIQNLEECIITKLVKQGRHLSGTLGISLRTGTLFTIHCKALILATGGLARIYRRSTNAWETIGDGYALALDAGAELQDLEMIQFHPTGMVYPPTAEGVLVTESVRGEGGILLNAKGERFMKQYDPKKMELSTRDIVARAVFDEIQQGRGTPNGGVWLDISHQPAAFIRKKLPKMVAKFRDFADIDITQQRMEVAPTAHYAMGGLVVDAETCASSIPGLFAAGEITAGVHGANRLGGNSLIDILVFGKRAGKAAALHAQGQSHGRIAALSIRQEWHRLTAPFHRAAGKHPAELKKKLQKVMWDSVGIVRHSQGLRQALKEVQQLKVELSHVKVEGSQKYNQTWIQYIDLLAMLPVCEAIILAALERTESRGAHFRTDFPKQDVRWLKNIRARKEKEKYLLATLSVSKIPEALKRCFA